jgi:hypothetical protein
MLHAQVQGLGKRLRLVPNTVFLAAYLAKQYAEALKKARIELNEAQEIEIAHSTVLLSSKMRERDIYCPMASHVAKVGGTPRINRF